ncbi:unnamed protein product, partial [Mesorhabditis belari]|uniref:PDZ domain-containing protein n=1 Tax=Mesorhabditis belari TaxID=2138241 RepID=A0AAF3FKB5_9BILA
MKQKHRNLDVIHHGLVLISDGKGRGRPSRLLLTKDQISIQIPSDAVIDEVSVAPEDTSTRHIVIKKRKDGGGLGLSIRGGDHNSNFPIVISKIFPDMPADETKQLFVGDAIVEVNGIAVDGKSHDEVVEMLKSEDDEVTLGVRHFTQITPYLKPASSLQPGRSGSALDKLYEPNTWKSAMKAHSDLGLYEKKSSTAHHSSMGTLDRDDGKWKTISTIPLPMAYLTRYLWGTDNLRQHAFELRAVDGTSSGVIHCEDSRALELWLMKIHQHINHLNQKSIKMSNKYLHQSEQITYIGWVNEHLTEEASVDPKQRWEPRFLILKGGDICLFETPPLNSDDLGKCLNLYKCYDVAVKQVPDDMRRLDKRDNCLWVETALGEEVKHYLAFESPQMMERFEAAYYRCVHTTINAMQTRTFACSFEGRPSGLVFDIKQGISLYDIPTKSYAWQYRFRDLHSSSDDGKVLVQLVFNDDRSLDPKKLETKDMECEEVLTVVYNLQAFLLAKIVAVDPEFLKQNPLQ